MALSARFGALPDVEAWIHLGDVVPDVRTLEKRAGVPVYSVRGNCDFDARLAAEQILTLEGVQYFACHGSNMVSAMIVPAFSTVQRNSNARLRFTGIRMFRCLKRAAR